MSNDVDKDADAGLPPNKIVCGHGHLCFWKRDSDGAWYVVCRDMRVLAAHQREVDDNFQKDFVFCPYCGGKLRST
jgi:hypothetical protein